MLTEYRRALEAQVQSHELVTEMKKLTESFEELRRYPTVADLARLVNGRGENFEDKDAVLGSLLEGMWLRRELFPVLNLMFLDRLDGIFRQKRRAWPDAQELFVRIQTEFFNVVVAYPLARRPRKIDVNLLLDTRSRVLAWLRRESRQRGLHQGLGPEAETGLRPVDVQESEVGTDEMETYLLHLLRAGVIDERQCDLLLETAVHRRMTQKQWAEARGVPEGTARSWRCRAEKAIYEHERSAKSHESAD